jgi:hypothetical protein
LAGVDIFGVYRRLDMLLYFDDVSSNDLLPGIYRGHHDAGALRILGDDCKVELLYFDDVSSDDLLQGMGRERFRICVGVGVLFVFLGMIVRWN